jgi:hypothetical protein
VKVLHKRHNLFVATETVGLSLPVYKPIAIRVLWRNHPPFWGGVELEGRMWYLVKVLHIKHNLFAGTETLSLALYEPIAMRFLWGAPHMR